MRAFLSGLIMPLPFLIILLLLAAFLWWRKRIKIARISVIIALLWFLLVSTPWIPQLLVKSLENRYPPLLQAPAFASDQEVKIYVLACGQGNDFRLPWTGQLATQALGRLTEGVRLYKFISGSKLITSAGKGTDSLTQAETTARAALELGVSPSDTFHLPSPTTTWEEALAYKARFAFSPAETLVKAGNSQIENRTRLLQSRAGIENRNSQFANQLILVTDALHMPRAMMLFRKAGLDPIPAPTNFIIKYGKNPISPDWWPSPGNIEMFGKAVHEYAGIVWGKVEK
jgi:uncharacterized SAM-binding protein YcdF (DUF218 family)